MKLLPSYLYRFLKSQDPQQSTTSLANNQYIMVNVTLTPPDSLDLLEHKAHLSVYEKFDKKLSHLSLLHFSCYFSTAIGSAYRVHAYFNSQAELMAELCFSVQTSQNTYTSMPIKECHPEWVAFFTQQSVLASTKWLNTINQKIYEYLNDLDKQHKRIETKCFELMGVPSKRNEYCEQLKAILKNLDKRAQYVEDPRETFSSINYTRRVIHSIESELELEHLMRAKTKTRKPLSEKSNDHYQVVGTLSTPPKAKKGQINASEGIWRNIASMLADFERFKNLPVDSDLMTTNLSPLRRMKSTLLQMEDQEVLQLSIENQIQLRQFSVALDTLGLQFLRYILTVDRNHPQRLQVAQSLDLFRYLLNTSDYISAIENNDFALIRKLIETNEAFMTAPIKLSIRKAVFPSLMHYCMFLAHQHAMPAWVVPCTKLLMEKGMSLLILDNITHLTFLEWIQLNPKHPLYGNLKNMSLILDLTTYVQLRHTLNNGLKEGRLPAQQRIALKNKIDLYDQMIVMIRDNPKLVITMKQTTLNEAFQKNMDFFSFEEKMYLYLDKIFMERNKKILELSNVVQGMVPQEALNQAIKSIDYKAAVDQIDFSTIASKSFEERKRFTMDMIDLAIAQLEASRMMIFGVNLGDQSSQIGGCLSMFFTAVRAMGIFAAANMPGEKQPIPIESRVEELDSDSGGSVTKKFFV